MSAESQAIFDQALSGYAVTQNAEALRIAAVGHIGASRDLDELQALYAQALEKGDHAAAQALADEMAPVRSAHRAAAGSVPRTWEEE